MLLSEKYYRSDINNFLHVKYNVCQVFCSIFLSKLKTVKKAGCHLKVFNKVTSDRHDVLDVQQSLVSQTVEVVLPVSCHNARSLLYSWVWDNVFLLMRTYMEFKACTKVVNTLSSTMERG